MVDFYPMEKDRHISIRTMRSGKPIIKKNNLILFPKNKLVSSLCSTFPRYHQGHAEGAIHPDLGRNRLWERTLRPFHASRLRQREKPLYF